MKPTAPKPSLTVKERNTPLPPDGGREPVKAEETGQPDTDGFIANFWALYPRQVDQQLSRKEWAMLAPSVELQRKIADAVKAWAGCDEWRREGGRFVPKPHRWLARKRWTDVPGRADAPASVDEAARTRAMLDAQAATPTLPASEVKRRLSELRRRMREPSAGVAA